MLCLFAGCLEPAFRHDPSMQRAEIGVAETRSVYLGLDITVYSSYVSLVVITLWFNASLSYQVFLVRKHTNLRSKKANGSLEAGHSMSFSHREREKLGDKRPLIQQVHEVTGVPHLALQGAALS